MIRAFFRRGLGRQTMIATLTMLVALLVSIPDVEAQRGGKGGARSSQGRSAQAEQDEREGEKIPKGFHSAKFSLSKNIQSLAICTTH